MKCWECKQKITTTAKGIWYVAVTAVTNEGYATKLRYVGLECCYPAINALKGRTHHIEVAKLSLRKLKQKPLKKEVTDY